MNAEFEAFLNNEVGKMYANDTQKLMLYRVDADERESYGYKDMGQIERLGALLPTLAAEEYTHQPGVSLEMCLEGQYDER